MSKAFIDESGQRAFSRASSDFFVMSAVVDRHDGPLQLSDLVASAVAAAFQPDRYGNVETRYLLELAPQFYRRNGVALTAAGLKLYPAMTGGDETRGTFPWLQGLE